MKGGVRLADGSEGIIDGSDGPVEVAENSALYGAGVWMYNDNHLRVSGDVTVRINWARFAGGGIGASTVGTIEMYDGVKIQENGAPTFGGGLWMEGVDVFSTGQVIIEENYVTGGAAAAGGSTGEGGGYSANGCSTFLFDGVVFRNNKAARNGGGMCDNTVLASDEGDTNTIIMQNVVFTGNTAVLDGGGLYVKNKIVEVSGLLFLKNTAARMAGGAVIDGSLEVVTMHNCSFIENTALGSCEGSQACGGGGAVSVLGNAVVHVEGSKFERNIAGNEGGGVYVAGTASLTLNMTKVSACKARFDGGGISTREASHVTLTDDVAIRNCESLDGKGGGILGRSPCPNVWHYFH